MILPPFNFPDGTFVLVTDELHAPADFLLHQSLNGQIKKSSEIVGATSSVVISASDDVNRWKSIASKFNMNLTQQIASGSVKFIDISNHASPNFGDNSTRPLLRPILDAVSNLIQGDETSPLVIVDDISTLEWIGFSLLDISRFTRALYALCSRVGATLLIRHHVVTPGEPDELFRHLLNICMYHLEVRPLYSGRSGAVSGEIALHLGAATQSGQVKLISRSSSLQYRLTDSGPVYFHKGTSEGVL